MTSSDLRLLLEYHYWAGDRLLEAVSVLTPEQYSRDLGSSFKSVRDTVVHLYSAEWVWLHRWQGISPDAMISPEQFPDIASLRHAWAAQQATARAFVGALDEADVSRVYDYSTTKGGPTSSVFWQMLVHVVNHASYHRRQVTTMLRQLGAAPPKGMDMILFYRERARA